MSVLAGYYQASTAEKYANTGLTQAQTSQVAANADAGRAAQYSQANANNAAASRSNAETAQVAPNAQASRALQGAQVGLTGAQAGLVSTQANVLPGVSQTENALRISQTNMSDYNLNGANNGPTTSDNGHIISLPTYPEQGDAKGGKVVSQAQVNKGKGGKPGPTDTVQAALTPGEIVLNKGAVEHYGSDVIAHMNRMGLMRMAATSEAHQAAGLPDPHAGLPGFGASHGAPQQGAGFGMKVADDAGKAAPKAKSKAA